MLRPNLNEKLSELSEKSKLLNQRLDAEKNILSKKTGLKQRSLEMLRLIDNLQAVLNSLNRDPEHYSGNVDLVNNINKEISKILQSSQDVLLSKQQYEKLLIDLKKYAIPIKESKPMFTNDSLNQDAFQHTGKGNWETKNKNYEALLENEVKFSPKEGGAKHGGKRTGVYTFERSREGDEPEKLTMLIKQGDSLGETVAEYVGGNLYQLTIPDHAAKALLVRDRITENRSANDVYVTSIFEQADAVQDAFKIAGYEKRPFFARIRHAIKKTIGLEQESLTRKVLRDDELNADNSLGYTVANVLWHGDHDVHMGNFVRVDKGDQKKYVKIDHGFSFFNFGKAVVDIFNPLAGKKVSISLSRKLKGGKLIEWYPFNNFWDLAAEKKRFYFSGPFIKGCEDIAHLPSEKIRENIQSSLDNVRELYAENAIEALTAFGKRMGINDKDLKFQVDADVLANNIAEFMTKRLVERQTSLIETAQYCRAQAKQLTDGHHTLSRELDAHIITLLDRRKQIKKEFNIFDKEKNKALKSPNHKESILEIGRKVSTLINEENALKREVSFLKMLEQANDLNWLEIRGDSLILKSEFYFHDAGERQKITPTEFKQKMDNVRHLPRHTPVSVKFGSQIPLTDRGHTLLQQIRDDLPKYKDPAVSSKRTKRNT